LRPQSAEPWAEQHVYQGRNSAERRLPRSPARNGRVVCAGDVPLFHSPARSTGTQGCGKGVRPLLWKSGTSPSPR
jgi:hypothetical protein